MSLMKWPGRRRTAPRAGWFKHVPDNELEVLIALADLGTLPADAQLLYADIQTRAETSMKATVALPAPDNVTVPPGMSFADWLKFKWRSADASVRNSLRTVAEALRVSVPLTRTRKSSVGGKDSPPTRRTRPELQPNRDDSEPLENPAEKEEPEYDDGPAWSDDDSPDWTPCDSLYDALHPDDRGWY